MDMYRDEVYAAAYILDLGMELDDFTAVLCVLSNQWMGGCEGSKTCLSECHNIQEDVSLAWIRFGFSVL
jgi:hypothetical protein